MTLIELSSPSAVAGFLRGSTCCLVTFSAHWCGPCKASKPQLEALARKYASSFKVGIAYESDLEDEIHKYQVRAFPTYVVFEGEREVERVEGANLGAVEEIIKKNLHKAVPAGGESLGGGAVAASPAEARALRLAKLGAGSAAAGSAAAPADAKEEPAKAPAADVEMKDADAAKDEGADGTAADAAAMDTSTENQSPAAEDEDPVSKLDQEALDTLTSSMGFTLLRAQKGLLFGGPTVDAAVEWLLQHQDDDDIDEPIPKGAGKAGGAVAQSYKCNECGKVLSNMANLELHANKTGHSVSQTFRDGISADQSALPNTLLIRVFVIRPLYV